MSGATGGATVREKTVFRSWQSDLLPDVLATQSGLRSVKPPASWRLVDHAASADKEYPQGRCYI